MSIRIGINGFGRIGRSFYKIAHKRDDMEVVTINDLGDPENLAYLLKYDTAQTTPLSNVEIGGEGEARELIADGTRSRFFSIKNPEDIPWGDQEVDIVVESTGIFTKYEEAAAHLRAGAKRVVISAPAKGDPIKEVESGTILMGINEGELENTRITSNASCTTNAGSPLISILHESIGIKKALLNTVHGYTASQNLVDGPSKDWRKGRAAAQNIIPTTTGAAMATTKAVTELEGKFDGIALRVPVIAGSIADVTFLASRSTDADEVNDILMNASQTPRWEKTFGATYEPIVSSDIIGSDKASIADLSFTRVVDQDLVKVLAWYDNEVGYSYSLAEHIARAGAYL